MYSSSLILPLSLPFPSNGFLFPCNGFQTEEVNTLMKKHMGETESRSFNHVSLIWVTFLGTPPMVNVPFPVLAETTTVKSSQHFSFTSCVTWANSFMRQLCQKYCAGHWGHPPQMKQIHSASGLTRLGASSTLWNADLPV